MLWNLGDLLAADEIYAAGYIAHRPAGPRAVRGPESEKRRVVLVRTALAAVHLALDDAFATDDRMALRWTLRGVDTGERPGAAPAGTVVTLAGITLLHLANGQVSEAWESIDMVARLHAQARTLPAAARARGPGRPTRRTR